MSIVLAKFPKQQQNNFLSGWTLFILGSVELRADEWPELWQRGWGWGVAGRIGLQRWHPHSGGKKTKNLYHPRKLLLMSSLTPRGIPLCCLKCLWLQASLQISHVKLTWAEVLTNPSSSRP